MGVASSALVFVARLKEVERRERKRKEESRRGNF